MRALNRQLGADDGLQAGGFRGAIELRRAIDAVTIEERDRGIPEIGRARDERVGPRGAVEK